MWWVYVGTIAFVLTLLFNARQEAYGPANAGWTPSWPSMKVADVTPGGPMGKAGVRAGDVLEGAGGQPLAGMPDWFVARAHFERGPRLIFRSSGTDNICACTSSLLIHRSALGTGRSATAY